MSVRLNDKRRSLDDPLKGLLLELQADATTQDLHTSAKKAGSFVHVKSAEDYQRDRQCYLQTLLQVPQARPLRLQCDVLREECGSVCRKSEYTPENLPLLLHQFYCDRVSQLVQLKHLHLVRWARFALRKPRIAEELHQEHLRRMEWIMQEYNYAFNAARRLAISHDLILANKPPPANLVSAEDVMVYIRWLVFTQHVVKNVTAFVTTIRWIPLLYQQELSNTITKVTTTTTTTATPSHQATPLDLGGAQAVPAPGGPRHGPLSKGRRSPQQGLPEHTVNVSEIGDRLEELKLAYSISGAPSPDTPSEHLQLYYHASRKFNEVFESQEQLSILHTYDKPAGVESIPAASRSKLTFRKPANWTPFVQIKLRPHPDPIQIKSIVKMKEKVINIDTVLELSSQCTHLHQIHRALYALKQHMAAVRHPSTITPISVSSHKTPHSTLLVWRCIYSGLDTRNPVGKEEARESSDTDEEMETNPEGLGTPSGELGTRRGGKEASPVCGGEQHRVGVSEAMKLIHAEDGRAVSAQAHSVPKDGYFAYVLLRHIRIRDCRTKCLEILNYFRSVERSLTINCEGLSLESMERRTASGLLDHRHLFRTPADYIVSQSEFMQFMEVENHDDYHTFEGDGHIRVRDHRGVHIVYDAALEDLDSVEKELLLVGSYYIQHREGTAAKTRDSELNISTYSHQSVDCFAVLLDLWSCEERFLKAKLKVVNCYLEAYHHVYDWREKKLLSKVITDLLWLRPRHDLSALYFTSAYEGECCCLAAHHQLIQTITSHQLSEERAHTQAIFQQAKDAVPGLPHPPVLKQPVSLTGDKGTLIQSYLLEFCSSLSIVASVYAAVNWSLAEIHHMFNCSVSGVIDLHCKVLELALQEWEQREGLGTSFTADVQKHVFVDVVVEDPHRMGEVFLGVCDEVRRGAAEQRVDVKEQDAAQMRGWVKVLQLVTHRHHMLITCSECETLLRVYSLQLGCLDIEECHAHLRCVPLDHSVKLGGAGRDLEYFLRQAREGSVQARLDSYSPTRLRLAVHELDEKSFGNFSFRSKEGLLKILTSRSGLEDLKTTLAVQVVYRNALLIACQQNSVVLRSIDGDILTGVPVSTLAGRHGNVNKKLAKCFVSIQLEKSPVRDYMLAQLSSQPVAVAKNRDELEESKSKLLNQYCDNLMMSLSHYSLRSQLLRYYESLHKLLEDFPATRKAYFIVGGGPEAGGGQEAPVYGSSTKTTDSRSSQSRLQMLLSADGKKLLNLWYIPSTIQILTMFSDLPLEDKIHALTVALHLISSLHDILAYLCTYVKLGTAQGPFGGDREFTGGWGGIERVGTEVQLLQNHIGQLNDSSDPWKVCEYLDYYRGILFLQHDVIMRHCLKRTLLLKDRIEAVQVLERVSLEAQECLRESPSRHLSFLLYPVPSPLDLPTQKPSSVFPWRAFFNSCGPFSSILQHCQNTSAYIYTSLAVLGPLDRSVANAEMLGLALLMEDVVHTHTSTTFTTRGSTLDEKGPATYSPHVPTSIATPSRGNHRSQVSRPLPSSTLTGSTRDLSVGVANTHRHQAPPLAGLGTSTCDLSASQGGASQPLLLPPYHPPSSLSTSAMPLLEQAKLLQRFLVKMSQVEALKHHWGLRVLGVVSMAMQKHCSLLEETYREKVVGVAQRVVAKKQAVDAAKKQLENESTSGSMSTFVTETNVDSTFGSEDGFDLPEKENLNELLLREAQIKHLLQLLEQYLVDDTCKHLTKIHHLLMAERQRDDTTLPLDLWKRSTMKDIVGLPRPHIVEDFLLELKKQLTEAGDTFTVPKAHLATCLSHMSSGVLAREKECYEMYASYYEAILKGQYHQIYLKNQEVEHYQWLAEANAKRTKQEDLVFMSEHTQSLILEITALRARVLELEDDLESKEEVIRRRVLDEYTSLVDCMFSATMDVKGKFTDYRKSLYDDMVRSLYEVRQATAESVGKMKDRLSGGSSSQDVGVVHGLKAEGCKEIQEENATLTRMMVKRRALAGWDKTRSQQQHNQELLSLSTQLDRLRKECFEMKMESEEKILSLQQQVQALQKSLGQMEAEYEVVKQSLEEEKQKRVTSGKLAASRAKESPMNKSEKSQGVKAEQLLQVLEEKDKVIQSLTACQDRARMQIAWDQSRASKDLQKMKQQLGHERALKLEAFHHADDLMTQVHNYEAQHTSLITSVNNLHPSSLSATSVSRMATTRTSSPQLARAQAFKAGTSQGRPRTASMEKGDMIDLSEEILALRLI